MRFNQLSEWLEWQETLHSQKIELGLGRVAAVAKSMGVAAPKYKTIVVAGTNGKGSTTSILESIFHHAGYRVGALILLHICCAITSAYVLGKKILMMLHCVDAFDKIDQARGETSLSYFEFGTLAAMQIFSESDLDVAIYEVGLGGRLDAVNILDADVAIVTSIGIDHVQWLGTTRESIGFEKAGVFRANQPAICGDGDPPKSLIEYAEKLGTELLLINKDYSYQKQNDESWSFSCENINWDNLPIPSLYGEVQLSNAATALMALNRIDECIAGNA